MMRIFFQDYQECPASCQKLPNEPRRILILSCVTVLPVLSFFTYKPATTDLPVNWDGDRLHSPSVSFPRTSKALPLNIYARNSIEQLEKTAIGFGGKDEIMGRLRYAAKIGRDVVRRRTLADDEKKLLLPGAEKGFSQLDKNIWCDQQ
ncbi:hypothetical protein BDZ45DRAFT_683169 [Acephala macrosclerotiorum]|nr:hypothetical protein BDZ45DRAFT_683169 [Acephala macrosclerotiorum]